MQPNPYAPPASTTLSASQTDSANAEALRREHIGTENNIRAVGLLFYLAALGMLLAGLGPFLAARNGMEASGASTGALLMALAVGYLVTAYGLRRLRGWSRIPTILLSGLGLLSFPIGTLINAYILYKVLSKQGRFVMKPAYQKIIAATPHVKYKTPWYVWLLLVMIIAAAIGFLVLAMNRSH